ncbi:hypothetical protein BDW59DRAFT_123636 [Aspergillus cavernicola]|uniref:Myb-like domain-containing protein n=1 Tax=Aspergillus cavernicola TaxID=176166 RepID=A0ABR4IV83_9EURO
MLPRVQFCEPLTPRSCFAKSPAGSQITRNAGSAARDQSPGGDASVLLHPLPPRPPSPLDKDNEHDPECEISRQDDKYSAPGASEARAPVISSAVVSPRATVDGRHPSDQSKISDSGHLSSMHPYASEQLPASDVNGFTIRDDERTTRWDMQSLTTQGRLAAPERFHREKQSRAPDQSQFETPNQDSIADLKRSPDAHEPLQGSPCQSNPPRATNGQRASAVEQDLSKVTNVTVVVPRKAGLSNYDVDKFMLSEDCDDSDDLDYESETSSHHAPFLGPKRHNQNPAAEKRLKPKNGISKQPKCHPPSQHYPASFSKPRKIANPGAVQPIPKCLSRSEYFTSALDNDSNSSSDQHSSFDPESVERIPIQGYLELSVHDNATSLVLKGTLPGLRGMPSAASPRRNHNAIVDALPAAPSRTGGQVHRRTQRRKRDLFTKEEDEQIVALKQQGYTWKDMERFFPERKYTALQSRWSRCLRGKAGSKGWIRN